MPCERIVVPCAPVLRPYLCLHRCPSAPTLTWPSCFHTYGAPAPGPKLLRSCPCPCPLDSFVLSFFAHRTLPSESLRPGTLTPLLAQEFDWNAPPRTEVEDIHEKHVPTSTSALPHDTAESMDASSSLLESWNQVQHKKGTAALASRGDGARAGNSSALARSQRQKGIGGEHDPYNFQPNKAIRKQQKANKKKVRKGMAHSM